MCDVSVCGGMRVDGMHVCVLSVSVQKTCKIQKTSKNTL